MPFVLARRPGCSSCRARRAIAIAPDDASRRAPIGARPNAASAIGRQARIKHTPELDFRPDDRDEGHVRLDQCVYDDVVDAGRNESGKKVLDLASLKGSVVLLNFFASWCSPCAQEWPELGQLDRALQAETTAAAVALALGGQGERPDPDQARAAYDEWLSSAPEQADPVRQMKLEAIGLR